ncbi:unnamed protein product [Polarella glacialis]|uniref:USP domain-containing protein n=1 Tax=Polarella glacialis TaxID=89957 RepID=A0A813FVH2_POLGL|nr:unnamed protein product [Polarella glacialis]
MADGSQNGLIQTVNGLAPERIFLPRAIDFVRSAGETGVKLGGNGSGHDPDKDPPPPAYYLYSRERLSALFEPRAPRQVGRGLENAGNTCFFNSVLQTLTYTAPLQKYLVSKEHTSSCKAAQEGTFCVLCAFEKHTQEVLEGKKTAVRPAQLLRHLPAIGSRFRQRGRQEDAHEFLRHFLEACSTDHCDPPALWRLFAIAGSPCDCSQPDCCDLQRGMGRSQQLRGGAFRVAQQDGNPSNGGQALVTGKCTAFCSVVYGATRYCGTGSTYDSTGSVNCQGCATTLAQISAETHEEDASMLQVKVKTSQAAADDLNKTFSQSLAVEVQCQAGSANAAYCGFNVPASGGLYPNQNKCWAGINTGATATGSCTAPSQGNMCWLQVATTLYPQSLAWVWYVPYLTCCNCWQMKDWTPSLIQEETQELPSDEDEVAHIQTFVHQYGMPKETTQEQLYGTWFVRSIEPDNDKVAKPTQAKSIARRIRGVGGLLDTAQRSVYSEDWVGLSTDATVLQAKLPLFSLYADLNFAAEKLEGAANEPNNASAAVTSQLRSALDFELSRLSKALGDFEAAVELRRVRDVERAFAEMSYSYDRYLKAASLYEGYDPITSTEIFYEGIPDSQLRFTQLVLQKPTIRDEVLVIRGPDKGKVGRIIWEGVRGVQAGNKQSDEVVTAVVKLDPNPVLGIVGGAGPGVREVKAYPIQWIALTRPARESLLLDMALGSLAGLVSVVSTYWLETVKSRLQAGLPAVREGPDGGWRPDLLNKGLRIALFRELPAKGLYIGGFNLLTRQFCQLPFIDANNPSLKLLVMIPAGALAYFVGTFLRAPGELLSRQMQTGQFDTEEMALRGLTSGPQDEVWLRLKRVWLLVIVRGIPYGALQCTVYDFLRERAELVQYGVPLYLQPLIWGALAGAVTGILTNPPDLILSSMSAREKEESMTGAKPNPDVVGELVQVTNELLERDGLPGFFRGGGVRALTIGLESMIWFSAFENLKGAANLFADI